MTRMIDEVSRRLLHFVGAIVVVSAIGCVICDAAKAAVISDPTLVTGADAIDPLLPDPNAGVLDATSLVPGAATKSDLTSLPSFGVIQNFNGFTSRTTQGAAAGVPAVNYFSFTDPNRPDARISSLSGNGSGGGGDSGGSTSGATTSPPAGTTDQYLGSNVTTGGFKQTIEFGTYDAGTSTFTADQSVSAAGFMITRINAVATNWTATFYDASNTVLSTQTTGVIQSTTTRVAVLFGYFSSSANIRRVEVVFQGAVNTFFDDLGFTSSVVVPEPASFALCGLAGCLLSGHRLGRRRRD